MNDIAFSNMYLHFSWHARGLIGLYIYVYNCVYIYIVSMDSLVACIDTCYECDSTIWNPSKWFKMVKPGVSDGSTIFPTGNRPSYWPSPDCWAYLGSRRSSHDVSALLDLLDLPCSDPPAGWPQWPPVTPVTPSALFQRCFAIFQELRWRWVPSLSSLTIEIIWNSWP